MSVEITLDGRIVIVAGAAGGGIGTTVTEMVARAGAMVVAVSRSQENLARHIEPLIKQGLAIVPVAADVTTDAGIAASLAAAKGAKGALWGLVNVAGGALPPTWKRAVKVTRDEWHALFAWNLETMYFMSTAVAAELRAQGKSGSIVSISSISGMNTAPFHVGYGVAKSAVAAATRTLAVELAADNIRVNCVAPGVTATPASKLYVADDPERDRRAIAMGRRADPKEQAGAILFLLSDLSSYITGQTILVDGGLNLKWNHLAADNTSLFQSEAFRAAITRDA